MNQTTTRLTLSALVSLVATQCRSDYAAYTGSQDNVSSVKIGGIPENHKLKLKVKDLSDANAKEVEHTVSNQANYSYSKITFNRGSKIQFRGELVEWTDGKEGKVVAKSTPPGAGECPPVEALMDKAEVDVELALCNLGSEPKPVIVLGDKESNAIIKLSTKGSKDIVTSRDSTNGDLLYSIKITQENAYILRHLTTSKEGAHPTNVCRLNLKGAPLQFSVSDSSKQSLAPDSAPNVTATLLESVPCFTDYRVGNQTFKGAPAQFDKGVKVNIPKEFLGEKFNGSKSI